MRFSKGERECVCRIMAKNSSVIVASKQASPPYH